MKSEVYFVKVEKNENTAREEALKKLLDKTRAFSGFEKGEIIPVKMTVGDSACVYNINPRLVKQIVAKIKEKKAKPFLFDTSVIYTGERRNAVDHLNLVQNKGFGHSRVGAPFLVADGVFGLDGKETDIKTEYLDKIKIPSFIGMLDSLVVLSHVTGHILSGYAGALKNVAMGMCCRATKQVQHSSVKPGVLVTKCASCGCCIDICPAGAVTLKKEKAFIDKNKCIGCAECLCACKFDAIEVNWEEDEDVFCKRMSDAARHVLSKFKNKFFVNFAFDITRECDCISTKHEKIISDDLGILASCDPVALDKATADLAAGAGNSGFLKDKKIIYDPMLEYAFKSGVGNLEYELIKI